MVMDVLVRNDTGCFSDVPLGLCPNGPKLQAFPAIEFMKRDPRRGHFLCVHKGR